MSSEKLSPYETHVALPVTLEAYQCLVERLADKFAFEDKRHVSAVISVAIRQLPSHQDTTTLEYLAGWVNKSLANHVAYHMANVAKHEGAIEALSAKLDKEPYDQQARDELSRAAGDGSELAKEHCRKHDIAWGDNPAATPNDHIKMSIVTDQP